jgi:histidine triad (HIT) family protein
MRRSKKLSHSMTASAATSRADGTLSVTVQQFSEWAGGQVVFDLRVHVMSRKAGVALKPPASFKKDPAVLSDQASKLAAALAEG